MDTLKNEFGKILKFGIDPHKIYYDCEELGKGSYGNVFKGKCSKSKKEIAIKIINLRKDEYLVDYINEIEILKILSSKYIITMYDALFYDHSLYYILEYAEFRSLDILLGKYERPFTPNEIQLITLDILKGLQYLHFNLIIHRDVKAGNILLFQNGSTKLADFGVSCILNEKDEKRYSFIGSPYWMAPELIYCENNTDQPYDNKIDIWSLGITIIELYDLHPPLQSFNHIRALCHIILSPPPTFHSTLNDKNLVDFLSLMLVKDPSKRMSSNDLLNQKYMIDIIDSNVLIKYIKNVLSHHPNLDHLVDDDKLTISSTEMIQDLILNSILPKSDLPISYDQSSIDKLSLISLDTLSELEKDSNAEINSISNSSISQNNISFTNEELCVSNLDSIFDQIMSKINQLTHSLHYEYYNNIKLLNILKNKKNKKLKLKHKKELDHFIKTSQDQIVFVSKSCESNRAMIYKEFKDTNILALDEILNEFLISFKGFISQF